MNRIPKDVILEVYEKWDNLEQQINLCPLTITMQECPKDCIFNYQLFDCGDVLKEFSLYIIDNHLHPELFI